MQRLQKQNIEHKAELFKNTDGGFGINIPNFKVTRDYKKGSKNLITAQVGENQCRGSGSERIRIFVQDPDPEPKGSECKFYAVKLYFLCFKIGIFFGRSFKLT